MAWVSLAFEIAKGLFALITEAVGANAKKLEELEARFVELLRVGSEELAACRAASKQVDSFTEERHQAAIARIRAARIAEVAAASPSPPSSAGL